MKLGILCHATYGGSGVVAAELGKLLARRGHQVHFVTVGHPFRLTNYEPNIFVHEVTAFQYPLFKVPPYFLSQVTKTVEVLRQHQLDLLHAHYAVPHSLGAHLARQISGRNVPVITTLHGTDTSLVGAHEEFYELTRYSLQVSDLVTVVSNYLARQTKDTFDFHRELPVIYNFVDTEVFRPTDKSLRPKLTPRGEALLVHLSNFRPLKRVLDVVKVFHKVRQQRPARLIMIGDGPEKPAVEKLANSLGLTEDILFLGQQDTVAPLLAAADVMLFPSCCESFGLAALEALSCGVPVIATNSGGIPEVISHGEVGFLTGVGQVEEMAQYTLRLLNDQALHKKMSHRAREYVLTKFKAERWVERYEKIYQEVLQKFGR
ncbi:N-acetyl-alpha-D-glucosaminyl L-malate synthase BshA [Desulforamulus ferrireducens]|uniref:N-acetyl-alpha-D-glucosaminyl L-malate synthase BshA n=1 Tax=Desulforamulus ferrireducens TaxID=1833852 RepID=A0A1S6IY86_9FIRM|nr:N-acetyl-alpha-D-glucosaminyl L-malate synthase BshA [Desulforamulus ferrireducens]AQS59743.1 N-acetyl-alpha-D-glucosaminyl L-malate synthase BshA [Desulforamulus ferrireducens]